MNKLYATIATACIAMGFAACSDDDCYNLHLDNLAHYPNVLKGTFPTENVTMEIGETLTITPELLEPDGAVFSWLVNGEEVSTEPTFSYTIEKPCRGDLTCVIQNQYGKVEMSTTFASNHDFSKGFFYVADKTFNFYDSEKEVVYQDCYSSLNAGKTLNIGNYDVVNIRQNNGKIYVLVGSSTSNIDHFYAIDGQTLYYEGSACIAANLRNDLVILDNQYGLVSGNGVHRINLETLSSVELTENDVDIYNGLVFNGKLLVNDTYGDESKVKYYDVNELIAAQKEGMPAAQELEITQQMKSNFVAAKDGNAYTLGCEGSSYYLASIDPSMNVAKIAFSFSPITYYRYSDLTVGMVASETENAVYIPSEEGAIYRYVIGDAGSLNSPFIAADTDGLPIVSMKTDSQNGDLYVIYGEKYADNNKIVVYNQDGEVRYTVDCGESLPSYILFNH